MSLTIYRYDIVTRYNATMNQTISTTPTAVTVYQDRARVVRSGSAELTTEITHLVIEELPLTLNVDSVRVNGRGTARVRIRGVDVGQRNYRDVPAEKVRTLTEQIEDVQDGLRAVADDKATQQAQQTYLDGIRQQTEQFARGLALGRTDVEKQVELLTFLQGQDVQVREQVRLLDQRERELQKTLQHLQAELKQHMSAGSKQRYRATVEVEVLEDGNFSAELTYVVNRAVWQPLYDVRLTESNAIVLTQLAQVMQRSGEDWENVALTLSTARPALNQRKPELKTWYINEFVPPPSPAPRQMAKASRVRAAKPMMMADAAPMAMQEEVAEAEVITAEVNTTGAAVTFRLSGGSDIPGDGSARKVTVGEFELNPKLDYAAVPKHTDSVFRRATVQNKTGAPLLRGQVSLFAEGEFIGRNQLPHIAPNDDIEFLLGVEDRITVERELVKRQTDKRFMRDRRKIAYGYKITLKNLLPTPATVTVEDHIPVPRHESITVKLESVRPAPMEQTDMNMLKWEVGLAAESEQIITYEYSVEHPREMNVKGLL